MRASVPVLVCVVLAGGCGGAAPADPLAAFPGKWNCDDGIVFSIGTDGRYDWFVPKSDDIQFGGTGATEHMRVNEDGSYSLLGAWRLSGSRLELDSLGETDAYTLAFSSNDAFKLSGDLDLSCTRA